MPKNRRPLRNGDEVEVRLVGEVNGHFPNGSPRIWVAASKAFVGPVGASATGETEDYEAGFVEVDGEGLVFEATPRERRHYSGTRGD
jgi:hypothetical protein